MKRGLRIAIVGGGLTSLTAGYWLSQKEHRVTIFEKNSFLGGLAGSFKERGWNWPLEFYFHHLFTSDKDALDLAGELGIREKIFFTTPKTSIFKKNCISQFDSPISVLRSPLLSPFEKIRTGLATFYLKFTDNWQGLEKVTAEVWLKKYYGQKTYATIWQQLLKSKFSDQADKVSMAWFWSRIKKRSFKLGYLEGGFQTLTDKLAEEIKNREGKILLNSEIKNLADINKVTEFDRLIVTAPPAAFLKMAPQLPGIYRKNLEKLKMIGAINLVLVLKEKFLTDGTYWLNVNEPNFPFVAVVEHTNFIDSKHYGGNHLLYVGGYYSQNHPYFKMSKEKIYQEFLLYLKRINPNFTFHLSPFTFHLSKSLYAQPIVPINYSKIIPPFKTPIPNVYLATMHQIYPWDRGINYAVKLGKDVAYEILKEQ